MKVYAPKIANIFEGDGVRWNSQEEVINTGTTVTLDRHRPKTLIVNPTADIDILLPALTDVVDGWAVHIGYPETATPTNWAITVKSSDGLTTYRTIRVGEYSWFVKTATGWYFYPLAADTTINPSPRIETFYRGSLSDPTVGSISHAPQRSIYITNLAGISYGLVNSGLLATIQPAAPAQAISAYGTGTVFTSPPLTLMRITTAAPHGLEAGDFGFIYFPSSAWSMNSQVHSVISPTVLDFWAEYQAGLNLTSAVIGGFDFLRLNKLGKYNLQGNIACAVSAVNNFRLSATFSLNSAALNLQATVASQSPAIVNVPFNCSFEATDYNLGNGKIMPTLFTRDTFAGVADTTTLHEYFFQLTEII